MPVMSSKFSLIVSMPDGGPVTHDLTGDSLSLGRGPDNDIQVLVSEVSVKHGELKAEGEGFKITDGGSTNGTLVNGGKVGAEGTALAPMDKILLGATISAYFVPSAVLAATPAAELIASIEASPKKAATPGTAKVAVAVAATPGAPGVKPAVAVPVSSPAAGATTVKLDQVRPGPPAPGPAKPPGPAAPAAPAAPGPPKPGAPTPVVPGSIKPPGAAPSAPAGPPPPAQPAPAPAPGGPPAPKPVSPVPLKRPGAGGPPAPAAPSVPLPGPPKVKPD